MKNKPGFKVNIGGESLIYIVIGIVIFAFIIFMPNIYKFISELKTGNAFKPTTPVVDNENKNNEKDDEDKIGDLIGSTTLVCSLTSSKAEGNLVETYTFYYDDDKLQSFKQVRDYDAIADDYLNYIYSERAKFNSMNNLYKSIPGFGYSSKLETRTLKATFIYDLTKLNPELLKSDDETLSISLNVQKDQTLDQVKTSYTALGYICK